MGPRLDGDITPVFMNEMIAWFKDQKVIHKKYAMKIILEAKKVFQSLPSLVNVTIPEVTSLHAKIFIKHYCYNLSY